MGAEAVAELSPAQFLDVIYALILEDSKETKEAREKLDALLDRQSAGRPDRDTWGRLPHHQRAMAAAPEA